MHVYVQHMHAHAQHIRVQSLFELTTANQLQHIDMHVHIQNLHVLSETCFTIVLYDTAKTLALTLASPTPNETLR
jgi:hypothetical protein